MAAPMNPPLATGIGPRLLDLPAAADLAAHRARFGPLPADHGQLIARVEAAGLRGRGGARFPTAVKLAAVARRRRPIVVVNATEGEPASVKDKALLHRAPHLVLDGAAAAGAAVGAREVIVAVERSAVSTLQATEAAVEFGILGRESDGLLDGDNGFVELFPADENVGFQAQGIGGGCLPGGGAAIDFREGCVVVFLFDEQVNQAAARGGVLRLRG